MSSLRAQWSRRWAAWAAMLALPCAVLGLALALVGHRLGEASLDGAPRYVGDPLIVPDAKLGFARPPRATTRVEILGHSYTVFTDARGLRSGGSGRAAPERAAVLVVGGSFAAGHGLEHAQSFSALLELRLGVTVANAAVESYGGVAALRSLARYADLEPRVVIYGLIADHLRRNLDPCAPSFLPPCLPAPHVRFGDDGQPRIASPDATATRGAFAFAERLRTVRDRKTPAGVVALGLDALRHRALRRLQRSDPPSDPRLRARALAFVLGRMRARAERGGGRLIVLCLPIMDAPHAGRLAERVRRVVPESVVVVDFAETARELEREQALPSLVLSRADAHPNAAAHELIARALVRAIEEERLL